MADKTYRLKFELSDGTIQEVPFTVPAGDKGDPGADGAAGADGTKWHYGTAVSGTGSSIMMPTGTGAKTGDFYLNTNTGNVYVSTNGETFWKYLGTMKSSSAIVETITQKTINIPQNTHSGSVDYTPVYSKSYIVLEVTACHNSEGPYTYGRQVCFSVLPKYVDDSSGASTDKTIWAWRMDGSSAPIYITVKIHEVQCG